MMCTWQQYPGQKKENVEIIVVNLLTGTLLVTADSLEIMTI